MLGRSTDPHLEVQPPPEQINTWAVCLCCLLPFCTARLFCRERSMALIFSSLQQVMWGRALRWHYTDCGGGSSWQRFIAPSLGTHSIRDGWFYSAQLWNTMPLKLDAGKRDSVWSVCMFVQACICGFVCEPDTHTVEPTFSIWLYLAVAVSWAVESTPEL